MTLSKTDRARLTRLRSRFSALTSSSFDTVEYEDLLVDSKEILTAEVAESLANGGVLSMDGTAFDEALDSYLNIRIGTAIEAAGPDVSPASALRAGISPRSPSEMRRLSGLGPGLDHDRKKLISGLNGMVEHGN